MSIWLCNLQKISHRGRTILVLMVCLAVFFVLAINEISLPGMYMDEVNPDYLIVKMLDSSKVGTTPSWQPPDNIINRNQRWPVVISYYMGTLSPYLGMPFHALFGFNLKGLRLYHSLYGAIIICLIFACIYTATESVFSSFLGSILLALDVGFSLSFRTQYQLILIPLPFLLIVFLFMIRHFSLSYSDHEPAGHAKSTFAGLVPFFGAGVCYGLSCWGYFIFWFYLPGLLLVAYIAYSSAQIRWQQLLAFSGGVVLGYGPWFFAVYSIWLTKPTTADFIASFQNNVQSVVITNNTFADRLLRIMVMVKSVISNSDQPLMVTGTSDAKSLTGLKTGLVSTVFVAACVSLCQAGSPRERRAGAVVFLGMLSFLTVGPFAGQRLSLHHLNANLPLLYLFVGISVASGFRLMRRLGYPGGAHVTTMISIILIFSFISVQQQASLFRELRKSGGNGNFSEWRTRLPYVLLANYRDAEIFFPEWGFFMQAVYLTAGELHLAPKLDPEPKALKEVLCAGQDAVIVVEGNNHRYFAEQPARSIGVSAITWRTFYQRDGKENFEMAVISHDQRSMDCSAVDSFVAQ